MGPNNSGKSNIIKFLLMMKQTYTSSLRAPLILNGNIINLGSFKNTTFGFNESPIEVKYNFTIPLNYHIEQSDSSFQYNRDVNRYTIEFHYGFDKKTKKIDFLTAKIKSKTKKNFLLNYEKELKFLINGVDIERITKGFKDKITSMINLLSQIPHIDFILKKGKTVQKIKRISRNLQGSSKVLNLKDLIDIIIEKSSQFNKNEFKININSDNNFPLIEAKKFTLPMDFYEFGELLYLLSSNQFQENIHKYLKIAPDKLDFVKNTFNKIFNLYKEIEVISESYNTLNRFTYSLGVEINKFYRDLYYIGPVREYPQRYYSIIGETARDVGYRGQYVPHLLKSLLEDKEANLIFEKTKYWLNYFEMAKNTYLRRYEEINELVSILCEEYFSGINVNITDMGFGTSQVLPIILEGYFIKRGSTFIIEQPEIHLHPKAQSKLGDLFIDIAKQNKNLIIETHSEHLIRRIQRRIAENVISCKDVAFYYVIIGDEGSEIKSLEINNNGYIKNIPEGFFDESYSEAYEHINQIIKRKDSKISGK